MEQLSFEELKKLISSGESKSAECKRISMFRDSSEILEQLSAFSNRDGGHLLFGLQDDGSVDGETFDADEEIERIGHLIRDSTSPLADVSPRLFYGEIGMVLDLVIRRRRGIPVAVVRRSLHEIRTRRYYVRTDTGSRFVDDRTLEWMFFHQREPAVFDRFRVRVPYRRSDVSLSSFSASGRLINHHLVPVFQNLTDPQKEELLRL